VILLAAVLILSLVSYGQVANSSSISQDALTWPNTPAQPVSSLERTDGGIAYVPQLRATGFFTAYMPIVMSGYCTPFTIADPDFSPRQFDMRQINADDAWLHCVQGDPGIIVAVIDTGVSQSHPDLAANLIPGASFVPSEPSVEDGQGHGSNVAGIVGAALNNIGVVGVAPRTHLLPIKVLNSSGSGSTSWVANGIVYAANSGARILNMSLGGTADSQTLHDAVNYAADTKGLLVVSSAGNCGDSYYPYNGCSYINQPLYPAAYSNVMAVAAVNSSDAKASFSNQGSYVDIAAPGVSIYNTYKNDGYIYESGTSQAAPHVAGLAALIWARYPTYTAAQVRALIEDTAVDLGTAGRDPQYGWGRIDAHAALNLTLSQTAPKANAAHAEMSSGDQREARIAPGRVLLKWKPGISAASAQQTIGALEAVSIEGQIEALSVQLLRVPVGQEWSLIDQLRALPDVQYAEPDYAVRLIQ
jgi:subtilisin family serine protease